MTFHAFLVAFAFTGAMAGTIAAADKWDVQYSFDQLENSLTITDLKFPTSRRGIASGFTTEKGKIKPTVLVTSDGGGHWTLVPVKDVGSSLYFLDDSLGWMVTDKGLWQTEEAGRNWHKVSTPREMKDILRVWFLDREHGYAVGERKKVWETIDGGVQWKELAAAAEPGTNAEHTTYAVVSFANAKDGIIAGWSEPPRYARVPDWMDPKAAKSRVQWPSTMVLLQTRNAGKTWDSSTASIFGRATKISFAPDGRSVGLIEFTDNFEWPSEVYRVEAKTGKSARIFRRADCAISDVLLLPSGATYLSGIQSQSTVHNSPIPGKVKIFRNREENWEDLEVDYKVQAHRTFIAAPDEDNIWVATDMGTILKLHKN